MHRMWNKPQPDECAGYYHGYIRQVPDGDDLPRAALQEMQTLRSLLTGVSEEASAGGYAPGKWSIREVVGHVADVERIMSVRALRFARGDQTPLPGMEQDPYVAASRHGARSLGSLLDELETIRHATVSLMRSFDEPALDRGGEASGARATVRAICYLTVGHAIHHRRVLEERYL
ncbi:MAG: DinB family protein [Acidobacteria bacterium]|nr:DinB family protein [Acidobacteriota bacterium]MYE43945.1 DinB family protein [Acidobacteriota bacterium]